MKKSDELKEIDETKRKLESMLEVAKQEMKFLEVEWLQLRGLAENKSKQKEANGTSSEVNLDDANKINAEEFNANALNLRNFKSLASRDESENDSSDDNE